VRNFGEIWVTDHSTTSAEAAGLTGGNSGDLLYRWGNPQAHDAGAAADQWCIRILFFNYTPILIDHHLAELL
jgi:hypothetical protein